MSTFSHYVERSRLVFKEQGLIALISKTWRVVATPMRTSFDKLLTRIVSPFAIHWFHKLLYYTFFTDMSGKNKDIRWLGVTTSKSPLDAWIYQEVIFDQKPDIIIETGTDRGGSALFLATILDLVNHGEIITIDITDYSKGVAHPHLTKIQGSSLDPVILANLRKKSEGKKVIVILDSDHTRDHVLKELEAYADMVSSGSYLIVEDTNINGHPVLPGWGPGPMEAVTLFLKKRKDFTIDTTKEKFFVTFFPNGFLKKS